MKSMIVLILAVVCSLYTYKQNVEMSLHVEKTKQTKEDCLEQARKHLFEAEKHMISMQSYTATLKSIKGIAAKSKAYDQLAEQTFERAMYHALGYKYEMGQAKVMKEKAQILSLNK